MSKNAIYQVFLGSAAAVALMAGPATASDLDDLRTYVDQRLKDIEKAQADIAKAQAELAAKADAVAKAEADVKAQKAAQPATASAAEPAALKTNHDGNMLGILNNPVMLYDDDKTKVHFYGLIEATLSSADRQKSATSNKSAQTIGFQTAWFSGNRYGFDADHALDELGGNLGMPDLKVITRLEGEFEQPNGHFDTNNGIFNRDAWVGFYSKDLGKVTMGRQNTLTRDFTNIWGDPYGSAPIELGEGGYTNVNNFKQFIFYSAGPDGTRSDSAVNWKKKWGEHWVTGLGYGFSSKANGGSADPGTGGALPGANANGSSMQASLGYNKIDIGPGSANVNANYDRGNLDDLVHQAALVGGNYTIGWFRVNTGYIHYVAQQGMNHSMPSRSDNAWTASIDINAIKKTTLALGYQQMMGHNAGMVVNSSGILQTLNPFFGDTKDVTAVKNGRKDSLYGSVMYHADRQTDFYVASDYMKVHGGWVVGDALGNGNLFGRGQAHNDEYEVATGVRFKF